MRKSFILLRYTLDRQYSTVEGNESCFFFKLSKSSTIFIRKTKKWAECVKWYDDAFSEFSINDNVICVLINLHETSVILFERKWYQRWTDHRLVTMETQYFYCKSSQVEISNNRTLNITFDWNIVNVTSLISEFFLMSNFSYTT